MIEERVVVLSCEEQGAWVEGIQQSACGACSAKSGCGQHALSQLGKKVKLWLSTDEALQAGEQIIIGLPEGALAKSALALYGIPLVALALGAVFGQVLGGEPGAIVVALLALIAGFKLAKAWSDKNRTHWQPTFIRRCQSSVNIIHTA